MGRLLSPHIRFRRAMVRAGCLLLIAIAGSAHAGMFEDGIAAYNRQDFATAFKFLQPLASEGEGDAQLYIGIMYENGQGVPRNYSTAVRWYSIAADQGHAGGQNNLAAMYAAGQGVPQDYAEARRWYQKAAGQGDAPAQSNLGYMYFRGKGVSKDYAAAAGWYRKAAEQGFFDAQMMLGVLCENGYGVPRDYVEAHKWFALAALNAPAAGRDESLKARLKVAGKMTVAQIAEAEKLAREWKPGLAGGEPVRR